MLNRIDLMGRLTRDPELRQTQSGKSVVNISLACDRDINREITDFFDVVFWDKSAEFVSKYFRKGSMVVVDGRLQARTYEKDGEKRTTYEIVGDHIYFADSKRTE